jgi:hypothetical protein
MQKIIVESTALIDEIRFGWMRVWSLPRLIAIGTRTVKKLAVQFDFKF